MLPYYVVLTQFNSVNQEGELMLPPVKKTWKRATFQDLSRQTPIGDVSGRVEDFLNNHDFKPGEFHLIPYKENDRLVSCEVFYYASKKLAS